MFPAFQRSEWYFLYFGEYSEIYTKQPCLGRFIVAYNYREGVFEYKSKYNYFTDTSGTSQSGL